MTAVLARRSVHDAADWNAVAVVLIEAAIGARVMSGVEPRTWLSPVHAVFAAALVATGEARAVELLGPELGSWTYYTGRAVWAATIEDDFRQVRHCVPEFTDPLYVPEELRRLPLLDLAADHAERAGRPTVVLAVDLPHGLSGLCRRDALVDVGGQPREVTLVELRETTVRVWAHELAHALDPDERVGAVAERFADALGELLDEHRPTTLADARPYIDQAELLAAAPVPCDPAAALATVSAEFVAPAEGPLDLPAPGIESIWTFMALPLLPRGAAS